MSYIKKLVFGSLVFYYSNALLPMQKKNPLPYYGRCLLCKKAFGPEDQSILCGKHRDHPYCIFKILTEKTNGTKKRLTDLLISKTAPPKITCPHCVQCFTLGPYALKTIYYACIKHLEALPTKEALDEVSIMPSYLAKKTIESRTNKTLFEYLGTLTQNQDPATLFMAKKQEDRLSLFNSLEEETKKTILELFWSDLSAKEQTTFLYDWCATNGPEKHALLFLLLIENHNLTKEAIINFFEKLVLEKIDNLTPHQLADTFSRRLPPQIIEMYAEQVINKLKTVEQKLAFLQSIWPMLSLENRKELFDAACNKIDPKTAPAQLSPFISSFPPVIAYKQFQNLLTIYTDSKEIDILIKALARAFTTASPDDLTECALKVLQLTNSARAADLFIISGPQKYTLAHILKLTDTLIKSPDFSALGFERLFNLCFPFKQTGNLETIIAGLQQLEKQEECLYELLMMLQDSYSIPVSKRAEMLRIYLKNPDAPTTKKLSLLTNYFLGHRKRHQEKHARFYTFSKLLKDEICELLSNDFENTNQKQLQTIWDCTDTQTQTDYFGYLTEKNRKMLSLEPVPENIATAMKNRSAKELMPIIANLPEGLFEPCYQKFDSSTKLELFKKLLDAKKGWTLLKHIKDRNEWAFYGENFPKTLTIDSPLRLFLYPKKEASELFLENFDITVTFIDTIQSYKNMLTENEKKIIWSKLFNADFYSIFFPPLTAQEAFELLKQRKK